jgi:excisionase family DNA binding protein
VTREAAAQDSGSPGDAYTGHVVPPPLSPHWDLDLLTPDDVCALLKVKKSWLYDAVETGALEAIRLGKQLRFRPSALNRYLDERASNGSRGHMQHLP